MGDATLFVYVCQTELSDPGAVEFLFFSTHLFPGDLAAGHRKLSDDRDRVWKKGYKVSYYTIF